jgi:flagellar biosynthetic protein FlhB
VSGEKTEKPTPKRLKEARREGRIPRSPDVGAWAGMLVASALLPPLARRMSGAFNGLIVQWGGIVADPDPAKLLALLGAGAKAGALVVAPLAGTLLVVGVATSAAQGGIHPATKALLPKFSRLNPLKGIKRTFGTQAVWETLKAVLKVAVIALALWTVVRRLVPQLMLSGSLPLLSIVDTVTGSAVSLVRTAAVAGLALAAADYAFIRRKTNKSLKMSKQEVKEEHRQQEGDPHMKGAIRSRQLLMSRNRMMAAVPDASVVMVNPTHVAVALRYEPGEGAPRVVARGAGAVARKIREVAAEHRVPLIHDPPLARALYQGVDVGKEIPPELYAAVARVLAFVLNLRGRGSAAGTHRVPGPALVRTGPLPPGAAAGARSGGSAASA